jgi:hypothetical protein
MTAKEFDIEIGAGFIISTAQLQDLVQKEICHNLGRTGSYHFSAHRIRVTVEYIEEYTCKTCPFYSSMCSPHYMCNSKVDKELEERRELL